MRVSEVPERGLRLDFCGEVDVEFVGFLLLELGVVCDAPVYVWCVARLILRTRARDTDLPFSVNVKPWNAGMCVAGRAGPGGAEMNTGSINKHAHTAEQAPKRARHDELLHPGPLRLAHDVHCAFYS